eukprot:GILJ01027674.1.p1 GENE.GILJ01027674.1~~GILJ01027674.1.p1  ORF type:complete len:132 (+),score=27.60 GILJ01027674.1:49-396(+)
MKLLKEKPEKPITAIVNMLENERNEATESIESPSPELAAEAREYVQKHKITALFEEWLRATIEAKPEIPLDFTISYFQKVATQKEEYDGPIEGESSPITPPTSNSNKKEAEAGFS